MLLQNKKVAIIGAGPVGLTMAKLLQQKGLDVSVYERDKNSQTRIWGGTLDLHKASGQQAIRQAGLLKGYFVKAIAMGRTFADEKGIVLFANKTPSDEQYDNPEINRNDLRSLLLDSLASNTVKWDRQLTELQEHNGKWILHFENGTTSTVDFVIGADGGMSKLRKYITDAEIEYSGSFMIQGDVIEPETKCPDFYQLCNQNIIMIANNGNSLVANPKNNGALTYNVIFETPNEWITQNGLNFQDRDSIITFLTNRCSHWHECYKQLFRSTTAFVGLPTRKLPLKKPWKNNRPLPITLIGDAAHIMPPFAGEGVNTGLKDAMILSDNLTNGKYSTIETAIKDYERQMFVYAGKAQMQTSSNEIQLHQRDFSFMKFIK